MEAGKKKSSSSSSFTCDLFGSKDSSSSASPSSQILSSIFAPPARVRGSESLQYTSKNKKSNSSVTDQASTAKTPAICIGGEEQNWSKEDEEEEEEKVQPFQYSSSIYYGGQDVFSKPQSSLNPGVTTFSKHVEEDDSGSASRGNWWQGSLYY